MYVKDFGVRLPIILSPKEHSMRIQIISTVRTIAEISTTQTAGNTQASLTVFFCNKFQQSFFLLTTSYVLLKRCKTSPDGFLLLFQLLFIIFKVRKQPQNLIIYVDDYHASSRIYHSLLKK